MSPALLIRKFIITLILIIFANISKVEAADTVINDGGTMAMTNVDTVSTSSKQEDSSLSYFEKLANDA